jgi:hypothetical protein
MPCLSGDISIYLFLFLVYLSMFSIDEIILRRMIQIDNEFERLWKENIVDQFKALSRHLPWRIEENKKTSVRIAGLQGKI